MLLLLSRRKTIYYIIEQNNSCTSWTGIGSLFLWVKKNACDPHQFQYLNGRQKFFETIQMSWMVVKDHSWPSISESWWLLKIFFCDHLTNIINFYIAFVWWRKVFGDVLTDTETDVDHKRFRIHLFLDENRAKLWFNPREPLGWILSCQRPFVKKTPKNHTHTNAPKKQTNKQKKNNHSKLVEMSEPINIPLFINVTDQWWLLRLIWIV